MAVDKVWVFAEAAEDKVTTATLELLTKAREIGSHGRGDLRRHGDADAIAATRRRVRRDEAAT